MTKLMIVEAPPKAKKIQKILVSNGLDFKVIATAGYVVDLPKDEYALNFNNNNIDVKWVYSEGKRKLLDDIKKLLPNVEDIYIATDDDREGEKIASDVIEKLNLKNYKRVVFTAITESKIIEAINNPRKLDNNNVKSAITRRIIDRDIGYPVSEIMRYDLRQKGIVIPSNLGCGRTISPTLHLLNENQKAIDKFQEEEYSRIKVWYQKDGINFHGIHEVRFMKDNNSNMEQLKLVVEQMRANPHTIIRYTPKNREEAPPEPLTTVTLQQSASNLYAFKGKHTMKLAQLLYYLGYISYHRTDSNVQSEETYLEIIDYLSQKYDEDDVLITKRNIKQKSKNVQNGHESIRPVTITEEFHPDNIKEYWLKNEQFLIDKNDKFAKYKFTDEHLKIYEIVWYRTLAVQMRNAVYDASEAVIDIAGNKINLTANKLKTVKLYDGGEKILSGWLGLKSTLLRKSTMIEESDFINDEVSIPEFVEGDKLSVVDITLIDGKTRPPYHYGEGRLIKKIDAAGIVRPSTLATVLPSLESKKCIIYVGNVIKITRLGQIVDDWISEHAFWLNDIEMGQKFEETLDKIANNQGEIDDTEFIMEYHERIQLLKDSIGYTDEKKEKPYEWQIEKALKIAKDNGLQLGEEIFEDKQKMEIFLENNLPKKEYESLGKCPACKKGKIKENTMAFGCSEFKNGCKFTLWKKNMKTFFERFGVQVTEAYLLNIIIAALKNEPLYFVGLRSSKGEKFDAFIDIKFNNEAKFWNLSLSFNNSNEVVKEEKVFEVSKMEIKKRFKNFKIEDELSRKIISMFNSEGNASICYAKFFIPDMINLTDEQIDTIGFKITEDVNRLIGNLYIDNEAKVISIILQEGSSSSFIEIIKQVYICMVNLRVLENKKIGCGIVYRRFFKSITDMETDINLQMINSVRSEKFKICVRGSF